MDKKIKQINTNLERKLDIHIESRQIDGRLKGRQKDKQNKR